MAAEVQLRLAIGRAHRNRLGQIFAEFERAGLVFVYRDAGPNDELGDFHEFVQRAAVPELVASGRYTVVERVA